MQCATLNSGRFSLEIATNSLGLLDEETKPFHENETPIKKPPTKDVAVYEFSCTNDLI